VYELSDPLLIVETTCLCASIRSSTRRQPPAAGLPRADRVQGPSTPTARSLAPANPADASGPQPPGGPATAANARAFAL